MNTNNPDSKHSGMESRPEDLNNTSAKQKVEDDARYAKQEMEDQARKKAEAGQHQAADEANTLSDAIDAAAANLDDNDRQGLARYARELSGVLTNAAGQIEGRSIDELASDAKRLARNNPTMFMLGSVAVGFGLSRFFKASADHDHNDDNQASSSYGTRQNSNRATDTSVQRYEQNNKSNMTTNAINKNEGRNML